LVTAKATVVSDDIEYTGYDVMSAPAQNLPAQALANLLISSPNLVLFHSVGNQASVYWEGSYNPIPQSASTCNGQTDNYIQQFSSSAAYITWQTNGGADIYLASALSAGRTTPNNFDVYVYDPNTAQIVTCSTSANGGTEGATSYTVIDGSAIAAGIYWIFIGTQDATLSGSFLKLIGMDDASGTSFSPMTPGAPSSPQDFAAGVITVGAVYGNDGIGNTIEQFSNTGPIQLPLPTPVTLQAPFVVAPDAIYVDNIGTNFPASGGIFYGTSAASPNAAAVAVLLRSAFPGLTPAQLTASIETGAAQLGGSAPNGTFGYGRVDALGALATIPAPNITTIANQTIVGGTSSGQLGFTLSGTGQVSVKANSDNAALIAATSQAIGISPSTCGSSTTRCNVTISPTLGQVGTAHITLSVVDGANRSTSTPITVTVTKPTPPTVSVTAGAKQTLTEGGAMVPVAFAVAGTQTLSVTVTSSNATLLPASAVTLTNGCGTTALACTATLGINSGQAGSSMVTITATDPYSQSGTATATVTVDAPPSKGGGGALDRWVLLSLSGLVLLKLNSFKRLVGANRYH
jgi:hypothetical protein